MSAKQKQYPLAIFDTLENIKEQKCCKTISSYSKKDFEAAKKFLLQYDGSKDTFNSYRREIERVIQWSWLIKEKSIIKTI